MDTPFQQHGAFSWCELSTSDTEAAKQFYGKLFNWTLEPAPVSTPEMQYTLVKCGDQPMGGIMKMPDQCAGTPPHWGVYVTVDDVDATAKMAEELGAKICLSPQDIPQVGRFCMLQDPQGAMLSVISYLPCEE